MPSQNTGVAYPSSENIVTTWLKSPCGRSAATTPIRVPSATAMTNAERVSISVAGRCSSSRDRTGSS